METLRYWNSQLERVGNALIPGVIHPNHLTFMRMIAVPILILLHCYNAQFTWMFVIVLFALLTDFFDGLTARSRNRITRLGTVLDPVADKVLALTALFILVYRGIVQWRLILWMCLAESHLAILPTLDYLQTRRGKPRDPSNTWVNRINPNIHGKLKVLFYSISFGLLFLGPATESDGMVSWGLHVAYVGVFFGGSALVSYLWDWWKGEV